MSSTRRTTRQIVLLPLFLAPLLAAAAAPNCYWPNGSIAEGYTPCNEGGNVANCCSGNAVCLDNGFCMNQDTFGNRLVRGACTDQTYGIGCTQTCADVHPDGQMSLILMGDFDPGLYCCGNPETQTNCSFATRGSTDPFNGPKAGKVIWDRKTGSTTQNTTVSTVMVTANAPTGTGGSSGQCTPGAAAATNADDNTTKCTSGSNAAAIGAGVGASLGAALAGVIGLLIWQIRKRRAAERELQDLHNSNAPTSEVVMPLYRDGPVEHLAELAGSTKGISEASSYTHLSPGTIHSTTTAAEGR